MPGYVPSSEEERQFLTSYDASAFKKPSVAVDLVITSIDNAGNLLVLLVHRNEHPFRGAWVLPGGFVHDREHVTRCAARVLREKTSLENVPLEELSSFSDPDRDPRTWVISIAHLALVPSDRLGDVKPGRSTDAVKFWALRPVSSARGFTLVDAVTGEPGPDTLGFDHDQIVALGLRRLQQRVTSSTMAFGLLPTTFTLTEAQRVVEAVLGKKLDRAAYRTKVLTLGLVRPTNEERRGGAHRPAKLYVAASGWDDHTNTSI